MGMNKARIGFILGIIVALLIGTADIPGLARNGQICMALSFMTVIFWGFQITQPGYTSGLYLLLLAVFGVEKPALIFSTWTGPMMFLIVGAYLIAGAVTRSISTSTIKELELDNALFAVRFNRKMQLDIFEQAQAKRVIDRAEQKEAVLSGNETAAELEHIAQEKIVVKERHPGDRHELNLDLENKRLKMRVVFNNCTLTAGYHNRYFVLNEVNAIIDIDTQKKLTIDFVTGKFGGTMVGDGVEIKGNINLAQQIPHYDLHLELYNILPASLGIADIKDTVSITASVTGELPNPVIDGHLDFKELNIPGLHFSKVRGDLHYEDALLKFTNVKGNVFGGTVEAFGDYHLDTKYYNIDALGHELLGSIAARNGKIKCKVELDFKIRSKGDPKTALTYGSFKSGKGSYYIIPFDSISGEFSNQNKHLEFKNVVIETKMGTIKTDAFDIVNGKLHIGEIYLEEPENGQTIKII